MGISIEEAEANLKAAKADYQAELKADSKRSDGSGAQELRRERHQQELAERVRQCERDLEKARQDQKSGEQS